MRPAVSLWDKVDMSGGPDACWPWLGLTTTDGYARYFVDGGEMPGHRAALELRLDRDLEAGECSLHDCDNPPCCNPGHLFPGTKAVNSADCKAKGRTTIGERNGSAKLTTELVLAIRDAYPVMPYGRCRRLSKAFGVSDRMVALIANGDRWAHLAEVSQ